MTVFAVMTAGLFPLIHIGRQWYFYWLIPYPNERGLWPNFKSPLIWDEFAIGTYFTVSTVFLIMGLIPDIAAVRDVATGWRKKLYAITALGWRGTNEQWRHYRPAYLYIAALATPLVLSVHSVVSWDFAMAQVPAWHETIFAPYFVAGAIYSGCAMVITLLVPMRKFFPPEEIVTVPHFENLANPILLAWVMDGDDPTWADWGIMAAGFGWFFMWFLLFVQNFPAVSVGEVKEELPPPGETPRHT